MIVSGHNNLCWGTILSGHKLNVSGHKSVWAQSCMGTNVVEPWKLDIDPRWDDVASPMLS